MNIKSTSLEVIKFIQADLSLVFEAWMNPLLVEKWFCPEGMKAQVDEWDSRENGGYRISLIDGDDVYTTTGIFLKILPMESILITYGWENEEEDEARIETQVKVGFKKLNNGTEISLAHLGIDPDEVENHKEGWISALENLANQLKNS